ncbi:MAG: twin-arginine translocase subunit TatC [Alphaproteobacteria bacterium]
MTNTVPEPYQPFDGVEEDQQPLVEHLIELRNRLLYVAVLFFASFLLAYAFSEQIFTWLVQPLASAFDGQEGRRLIYTGLPEAFVTYLKVAFFAASFISLPFFLLQIWRFIAPGLYKEEKRAYFPFIVATPVLFVSGACFAYYAIIPAAWKFFLQFEMPGSGGMLAIQLEARVQEYLSLVMQLLLAFGISFQLPVALVLSARAGLVNADTLVRIRKYAFLMIMIASAFLTPPDVLSMLGLALPLYMLYEGSIVLVKMLGTKPKEKLQEIKE